MNECRLAATLVLAAAVGGLGACGKPAAPGADHVFVNAAAYTLDADMSWAEALAVEAGRIVFVGDNAGARALAGPASMRTRSTRRMCS